MATDAAERPPAAQTRRLVALATQLRPAGTAAGRLAAPSPPLLLPPSLARVALGMMTR